MKTEVEKEILKGLQDIKLELAKYSVHQEQHRKEIDYLNKSNKKLNDNQNKFLGAIALIGIAISAFFSWLFKHM